MPRPGGQQPNDTLGAPPKDRVFREFGGMNVQDSRQMISDEEFFWLENLVPLGAGQLGVVGTPTQAVQTITGQTCISAKAFNFGGSDFIIAIMSSGRAWKILAGSPYTATEITASLGAIFSANTRMAQWKSSGVLFIDPNGYWDYNITATNALSPLYNAVLSLNVVSSGSGYANPTISFSGGGGGSGAAGTVTTKLVPNLTVNAGGTGYTVGDVLLLVGGTFNVQASCTVATIGGGGAVATVTITTAGDYTNNTGAGNSTTGGTGTGCTLNTVWGLSKATVTASGGGYLVPPTVVISGGFVVAGSITATISGTFAGTCIDVYAGRVWVGNGRAVAFTDVDSYSSFSGAGGSFTISDSTLHHNLTAFLSANGYLYLFGDDSIDMLGDVQVSGGATSFTRQNITASIGTSMPWTIFPYYRSVYFQNASGMYALSGATPQKISDKIDPIVQAVNTNVVTFAGAVQLFGNLCPVFNFQFTDKLSLLGSAGGTTRNVMAARYNGKWIILAQGQDSVNQSGHAVIVSVVQSTGTTNLYGFRNTGGNAVMDLLFQGGANLTTLMQSKLWDFGTPLLDKQVLKIGTAYTANGINTGSATLTTYADNEFGSQQLTIAIPPPTSLSSAYQFGIGAAQSGGGKYAGISQQGSSPQITYKAFALQVREGKLW